MNVSRNFMVIALLYILVGMLMGMYMGGSQDFTLRPLHAHINLLGFVLPMVFAIVYHLFPGTAEGGSARVHFWLYEVGLIVSMVMLYMVLKERIAEDAAIGILLPISEALIVIGTAIFAWNVWQKAK